MTFLKNSWYFVEFLDHSMGSQPLDSIACQIIGKFHSEDDNQYAFIIWENTHKDYREENREFVTVIKGTITKKKKVL